MIDKETLKQIILEQAEELGEIKEEVPRLL